MAAFLKEKGIMMNLVLALDGSDPNARSEIHFLLAIIASWETSDLGYKLVFEAFNYYSLVKREQARFEDLVNVIKEDKEYERKARALMLVNALITSAPDDATRLVLQKEFFNLGLLDILENFKSSSDSETFNTQSQVFEEDMKDMKKELNSEELKDPISIVKLLNVQIPNSNPSYGSLMNILWRLLVYAGYGLEKSKDKFQKEGWKTLENIIKKATQNIDGTIEDVSPAELKMNELIVKLQAKILDLETQALVDKDESKKKIDQLTKDLAELQKASDKSSKSDLEAKLKEETKKLDDEKKLSKDLKDNLEKFKKEIEQLKKSGGSSNSGSSEKKTSDGKDWKSEYDKLKKDYDDFKKKWCESG